MASACRSSVPRGVLYEIPEDLIRGKRRDGRRTPGLDHYCITIKNFKAEAVVTELKQQGLKSRRPAGTDRIYFPDPDGLEVQLSAIDHEP